MSRMIQPGEIIAAAEWHCGVAIPTPGSPVNRRRIRVRQIAASVMHTHLQMDSVEIGQIFGVHASTIRIGWRRSPVKYDEYHSVVNHAYLTLARRDAELALADRIETEGRGHAWITEAQMGVSDPFLDALTVND